MTEHLLGFVLAIENFRANDLNLIFFSKQRGKIRILVKGGRKLKSKLRWLTQFFSLNDLVVVIGRKNTCLIGGEEKEVFRDISINLLKIKSSCLVLGKLNDFTPFLKPDERIFLLASKTLREINSLSEERSLSFALAFIIKFISFLGFKPELKQCLFCHKFPQADFVSFDFKEGGVVCPDCQKNKDQQIKISLGVLRILQKLLYKDYQFLAKEKFLRENLLTAESILQKFLAWRLP